MGEWWAVASEYRLKITCIAGAMMRLAKYINFIPVRVNIVTMLLHMALPPRQVSNTQKDDQSVQIMMKAIINGSRCWIDNTLKWASTEHQLFLAVHHGKIMFSLVAVIHLTDIGSLYWQNHSGMLSAASWERASTERQWFLASQLLYFIFRLVVNTHFSEVGRLYWQKQQWHAACRILKMSINEASTILVVAYLTIKALCGSWHS